MWKLIHKKDSTKITSKLLVLLSINFNPVLPDSKDFILGYKAQKSSSAHIKKRSRSGSQSKQDNNEKWVT